MHKHRWKGYVVLGLIIAALITLNLFFPGLRQFASPEFVRDYLLSLGNWAYVMYIIIFLLSIPLPIPSLPIAMVGGYVFGFFVSLILTLVAAIIGASISFLLIRRYGEPLLERMVSKHHIIHFNHIFKARGINGAIIAYAIPVFPSDALNFLLGMTKIRYHTFLLIAVLGSIPRYLIVNSLGDDLHIGFTSKTVFTLIFAITFVIITVFRERIKKIVFKELHTLEKEAKVLEKEAVKEALKEGMSLEKGIQKLEHYATTGLRWRFLPGVQSRLSTHHKIHHQRQMVRKVKFKH